MTLDNTEVSSIEVKSLRAEGVPGVLRLDSRNCVSLHVHRIGADLGPVLPSQVTQKLRVSVAGNIALIEPGCLTGCGGGKLSTSPICCAIVLHSLMDSDEKNNRPLTFQCSGKEMKVWRKKKSLISYTFCFSSLIVYKIIHLL